MVENGTYAGIGAVILTAFILGGMIYSLRPQVIESPIRKARSEMENMLNSFQVSPKEASPTAGQGDIYMNGKHMRVENGKLYEVNSDGSYTELKR